MAWRMYGRIFSCLLICVAVVLAEEVENTERDAKEGLSVQYGLMMDAGSTGTRVHTYRWVWRGGDLPDITDDYYYEIPVASRKDTWVKLTATAGLRLLPQVKQDAVLSAVTERLKASPFQFQEDWVTISEGVHEAVDAWLSANYIMESVVHDDPGSTVGTLDLGGGSMQIACRPTGSSDIPNEGEYNVSVAGNEYGMYAISHLSYGLMQARRRVDALVRASAKPGQSTVEHPCLLNGTTISFHDETHDGVTHAVGTSDHDKCLELQEQILSDCSHTPEGKCSPMKQVPPPDTSGRFLAFSYFHDVLSEFLHTTTPTVGEIKEATMTVCALTHKELHDKHSETYEPKNPEFLRRACQDMTYILRLLAGYLNFHDDHQRIELVKNVKGKEMSWTLGQTLRMLEPPTGNGSDDPRSTTATATIGDVPGDVPAAAAGDAINVESASTLHAAGIVPPKPEL